MKNTNASNMNNGDYTVGRTATVGTTTVTTTVTSPSSTAQQTFTTAGTPYKQSSQSFQRPERRNRLLRSGDGIQNGLSLLPKHDIQRILANGGSTSSSTHQYTPLQQNNDRAINPAESSEFPTTSMGPVSPVGGSRNSLNSHPALSFGSSSQHDLLKIEPQNDEDDDLERVDNDDDGDVDFTKYALTGMALKSIQNLASYPNPNQEIARKYLAQRARKSLTQAAQSNGGPSGSSSRVFEHRGALFNGEEGFLPTADHRSQLNDSPMLDPAARSVMHTNPQTSVERTSSARSMYALNNTGGYEVNKTSSTILAPGPGAPRPLTAGPPGQRQLAMPNVPLAARGWQSYRSNAYFESTQMNSITRRPLPPTDTEHLASLSYTPRALCDLSDSLATAGIPYGDDLLSDDEEYVATGAHPHLIGDFAWEMMHSHWTYVPPTYPTYLGMMPSRLGVRYERETGRMTKETIQARTEKINNDWYSGIDFISQSGHDMIREARKSKLDSMGPSKVGDKTTPLKNRIANRLGVLEHADPLIKGTLANLVRFEDEQLGAFAAPTRGPSFWPLDPIA